MSSHGRPARPLAASLWASVFKLRGKRRQSTCHPRPARSASGPSIRKCWSARRRRPTPAARASTGQQSPAMTTRRPAASKRHSKRRTRANAWASASVGPAHGSTMTAARPATCHPAR
eukprot:9814857-Alexandrium_andersonii.AAC.1